MAYAAVANDGVLMRPRLVLSITDPDGKVVFESKPEKVRRVMDEDLARTIRSFMQEVMTAGTGTGAALSWVNVGGKTGTTEKYVVGSGYSRTRHYASFVGIAPLDDPKIVCFVMIDEPNQTASYGGSAAAPVFHEMLEAFGRLPGSWLGPDYEVITVEAPRHARGLRRLMSGPPAASAAESGITVSSGGGLPNVRGKSLRLALQILGAYGVTAKIEGSGVVSTQSPAPGSRIRGSVDLFCSEEAEARIVLASETDALREEIRNAPGSGSSDWR